MFKSDLSRTVAAMLATLVVSATCLTAAVGPAQPGAGKAAVALAAKALA